MRSLVEGDRAAVAPPCRRAHLPNGRQIRRSDGKQFPCRSAGTSGKALLHHRCHRVFGHCAGRTHPALHPRGRDHRTGPPRPPGGCRRPAGPRDHPERLLRPPARASWATASPPRWPAGSRPFPATSGQDGLGLDDDGRAALAASDIVIHSAATVSFDAPLTQAVEINLLGPARVGAAVAASGSGAHLISVSTAYVASTHQGEAKEELLSENRFTLDIDWEDEVKAARRLRDDLQAASRRTDRLAGFTKEARSEIGGAGDHLLAARAEKIREEWVRTELVDAGTARAHSLGWPDAYPFTKAMGERVLVQQWAGTVPITFVRPSIIESALDRAAARLDPRLPHGRADHHLLRPRPAARVPRRARGHHRRHPGRPGGGRHPRRGRPRARTPTGRPCTTWPRACGTRSPTATWSSCARTGSAATRSTTSGASRSACPSGPSPAAAGCSASSGGPIRP